jgi:hypothetical protein
LAVRRLLTVFAAAAAVSCLGSRPRIEHPEFPNAVTKLSLAGQFSIPSLGRFPPVIGLPFGGISGLTSTSGGRVLYGISDAQQGGRLYTFDVDTSGPALRVSTLDVISLAMAPGDENPDPEGIVLLPDNRFAISAEGTEREPRQPPMINIYGRHSDFVETLTLPEAFVPEPTGPQSRGARGNTGFESLTLSPDASRLFTATETALVQDGQPATFDAGTRTRILEFAAHDQTFRPARQFAYDLEPLPRPPYAPGFYITGVVDLLALSRTTLLALERGFVESAQSPTQTRSTIRIYHVDLSGATDVSTMVSLAGRTDVLPAKKTLLLDLSTVKGLSPELEPRLENFEGLAIGPRLADGRATLVLVSDDNFSAAQRTWFLLFAIE